MVAGQSAGCFGSCVLWWHTRCLATSSSVLSIVGHLCYLSCLLPTAPTACWLAIPQCQNAQIYFRLCTCISFFLYFCIFHVCICYLFCLLLPLSGCVYSPHGPPHRVTLTHLATLRLGVCHHQTKSLPGFRFLIQHI